MPITLEETRRIARLAHLRLEDAELETLRGHLGRILDYVDQLTRLDTTGVEPAIGMAGLGSDESPAAREDAVAPGLTCDEALANAPASASGHFKVPKVIP